MTKRYYLDTSIWIDIYEDRVGFKGEPLGDYAFQLIKKIKLENGIIAVSNLNVHELEKRFTMEQINGFFKYVEEIMEKVISTPDEDEESIIISLERKVPRADALHAILARDNGFILIARDNHFALLKDISPYFKPEDLV